MEFPWRCGGCDRLQMVDLDSLLILPVSKIVSAEVFECEFCGKMEAVSFMTVSLESKMRKLLNTPPTKKKFLFLFKKTLKKAEGVNRRGEFLYGKIGCEDMAPFR